MSFYSSNQTKLKKYTADRKVEETNGNIQQAKVYQKIAETNGDIETAQRLAKLGINIVKNIANTEVPIVNEKGGVAKMSVIDHIKSMIEAGSLSNWWEAVKKIPPRLLSDKAKIIQDDIKHNAMMKEVLNELLTKATAKDMGKEYVDNIIKEIVQTLSGGDVDVLQELDNKAYEKSMSLVDEIDAFNNETSGLNKRDIQKKIQRFLNTYNKNKDISSLGRDVLETFGSMFDSGKTHATLKNAINKLT